MGPDTTYIHCTDSTDEELDLIAETGGTDSIAPYVEMLMGHGVPPTGRLLERGVRPSLSASTSSPASRARCSRRCARRSSTSGSWRSPTRPTSAFAPTLTHRDVLEFATIDGARACGLDHEGRLAHARASRRTSSCCAPTGQRRAADRPGRDRGHLRRHVERRLGVRRGQGGEARTASSSATTSGGSSACSSSRATTSSRRRGCCRTGLSRAATA